MASNLNSTDGTTDELLLLSVGAGFETSNVWLPEVGLTMGVLVGGCF